MFTFLSLSKKVLSICTDYLCVQTLSTIWITVNFNVFLILANEFIIRRSNNI